MTTGKFSKQQPAPLKAKVQKSKLLQQLQNSPLKKQPAPLKVPEVKLQQQVRNKPLKQQFKPLETKLQQQAPSNPSKQPASLKANVKKLPSARDVFVHRDEYDYSFYLKAPGGAIGDYSYYDIKKLQAIEPQLLNEYLYGENDFVVPPRTEIELQVKVNKGAVRTKLGCLFFEFEPLGIEGCANLTINYIDTAKQLLVPIFSETRYGDIYFKFEDLCPLSVNSYHKNLTYVGFKPKDYYNQFNANNSALYMMLAHNIKTEIQIIINSNTKDFKSLTALKTAINRLEQYQELHQELQHLIQQRHKLLSCESDEFIKFIESDESIVEPYKLDEPNKQEQEQEQRAAKIASNMNRLNEQKIINLRNKLDKLFLDRSIAETFFKSLPSQEKFFNQSMNGYGLNPGNGFQKAFEHLKKIEQLEGDILVKIKTNDMTNIFLLIEDAIATTDKTLLDRILKAGIITALKNLGIAQPGKQLQATETIKLLTQIKRAEMLNISEKPSVVKMAIIADIIRNKQQILKTALLMIPESNKPTGSNMQ